MESSGGDPDSYVQAFCDAQYDGPYDSDVLSQTISTCAGETYDFSVAYNMMDAVSNNYLNIFANSQYIVSVQSGGSGSDSLGNPPGQWNTFNDSYTTTSASTVISVYFTCTNSQAMTFGLDSFFWTAEGLPYSTTITTSTTTTTTSTSSTSASTPSTGPSGNIICSDQQNPACDVAHFCDAGDQCICFQTWNGGSACISDEGCGATCATDTDCTTGEVCTDTCCGLSCMPYDNTCANTAATRRLFKMVKRIAKQGGKIRPGYKKVEGVPYLVPDAES